MRWERPAAGREPAAAALLGWLADPRAPGLCLVSGSSGCGKSELLAWLVHHGTQEGIPAQRAVHAVVPHAGESLMGIAWSIADQLGVVAGTPEELVGALKRDVRRTVVVLPDLHSDGATEFVLDLARIRHLRLIVESRTGSPAHRILTHAECAELDLDLDQWRDQHRYEQWQASGPKSRAAGTPSADDRAGVVDLSDPVAVCEADPWLVTVGYERSDQDHGGLRSAWLKAGQSLSREQSPASRAVLLSAVLGDSADPRLAPALAGLALGAPWRLEWSRVRGDLMPPWPGPVTALAAGAGPLADCLVIVALQETVRVLSLSDAASRGRAAAGCGEPQSLAVMADGTVLLLDQGGRVHAETAWAARPAASGIERLLDDGPSDVQRLLTALEQQKGTSLGAFGGRAAGFVVLGDAAGVVKVFGAATESAVLHQGPVTAVAGLSSPLDGDECVPLVYSGGADGTVRAWAPGHSVMAGPVIQRACPVISLDVTDTASGPAIAVAWEDGAVDWIESDTGAQQTFRPGPPVRSVALTADNRLFIGTDEAVTCLTPVRAIPDSVSRGVEGQA